MIQAVTTHQDMKKQHFIQNPFTGSSMEEKPIYSNLLFSINALTNNSHLKIYVDASTIYPCFEAESKSFLVEEHTEEDLLNDIIKHDFIIRMPPIKKRTVRFKIKSVEKATPKIAVPEGF